MEITDLSAVEVVNGIAQGDHSALEVAEAYSGQIKRWAPINAVNEFDEDRFLAAARDADKAQAAGEPCGPLHGLPLLVKDNIDVIGCATTASTPALKNNRPTRQGPVIQALQDAGAIVMAKANMHELAFSPAITKPADGGDIIYGAFGNALNPYDHSRAPAGSSSGTGVGLAARIAPAGLGSDTGGSVRNPAAWCGISGLRPTINRYSADCVVPISSTRDTIGPMARSVGDLALLDGVITGDTDLPAIDLATLRLGIDRDFFCTDADPDVLALFDREIARLGDGGVEIVEVAIPDLENLAGPVGQVIALYEFVRTLPQYLIDSGSGVGLDDLVDQIAASGLGKRYRELMGDGAVAEDAYKDAMKVTRPALQAAYAACFADHNLDALVFPATLIPPMSLHNPGSHHHKGKDIPDFAASGHNVQPSSIGGSPGLTVAAGLIRSGLPAALGFDGPVGSDRRLLAIGLAYESLRPDVPPPPLP